jgi:hypothetical protein
MARCERCGAQGARQVLQDSAAPRYDPKLPSVTLCSKCVKHVRRGTLAERSKLIQSIVRERIARARAQQNERRR